MKLRNKKTGEIKTAYVQVIVENNHPAKPLEFNTQLSIAELNEDWEDANEEPKPHFVSEFGDVYPVQGISFERKHIEKLKTIGNYFETEEEAKKAVEKLNAWTRLKDKGFKFEGWTIDDGLRVSIRTNHNGDNIYSESEKETKELLDLLFGGEE